MSEYTGDTNSMSQNEAIEHVNEKYLEMVMNRQQAGREIPARPVYAEVVGDDMARTSVEASQRLMHKSRKMSFNFMGIAEEHYKRIFKHD